MIGVVGVLVGLLIGSTITNAVWVLRSRLDQPNVS